MTLDEAMAEIDRLKAALEFYSNRENWTTGSVFVPTPDPGARMGWIRAMQEAMDLHVSGSLTLEALKTHRDKPPRVHADVGKPLPHHAQRYLEKQTNEPQDAGGWYVAEQALQKEGV